MLVELQSLPWLVIGQLMFYLALGPIFYLLISYLAHAKESGHWSGLWHTTPIILSLILAKSATHIVVYGAILQLVYAIASVRMIRTYHRAAFDCRSDAENTKLGGLYLPLAIIGAFAFLTFAVLANWVNSSPNFKGAWLVLDFYLGAVMLLWIVINVVRSKRLFKGLREYELMLDAPTVAITPEQRTEHKNLFNQVEKSLSEHGFFAVSDLSLSDLAEKSSCSVEDLSHAIKQEAGLNFCDFINSHRVMAVKSKIDQGVTEIKAINDLALNNGFVSIKSFQKIFKRFVGSSPRSYLEDLQQN